MVCTRCSPMGAKLKGWTAVGKSAEVMERHLQNPGARQLRQSVRIHSRVCCCFGFLLTMTMPRPAPPRIYKTSMLRKETMHSDHHDLPGLLHWQSDCLWVTVQMCSRLAWSGWLSWASRRQQ